MAAFFPFALVVRLKLIQNIPCANDGKQHKDGNNNNLTKYLESNKDALLDLAKKNYEILVEALTNDTIDSTASSSNPTLLLPQSSSTCSNPFDQSDIYRIEKSETYHNSKGDVAD
jgi:hypothetical protein